MKLLDCFNTLIKPLEEKPVNEEQKKGDEVDME